MSSAPASPPPPPLISEYADGGFTVADEFHHGSIIITGEEGEGFVVQPWSVTDEKMITRESLEAIYGSAHRPMLVLLGVGDKMEHPFAKLRVELAKEGIGVEIQTTPAACRTWNLLLSEGRKVAFAAVHAQDTNLLK